MASNMNVMQLIAKKKNPLYENDLEGEGAVRQTEMFKNQKQTKGTTDL